MLKYFKSSVDRLLTAYRLGFISILRVVIYKQLVKYRLHNVVRIQEQGATSSISSNSAEFSIICSSALKNYDFKHFWFFNREITSIKEWKSSNRLEDLFLTNWFNGYVYSNKKLWYEIGDFEPDAGDIKGVWELSRWYWALRVASDSQLDRNYRSELLEQLVAQWQMQNPFLRGPNWKCGQEVSLRMIHYIVALRILGFSFHDLEFRHRSLIEQHLMRITPTLSYAKGQKNNHWISEAVGLIIGGIWFSPAAGKNKYLLQGVNELECSIESLFNEDGSFAQSSFNYLRHALTLIAIAKLEMSSAGINISFLTSQKLRNALNLFEQFVEEGSYTTHNWGANDGSNPLAISGSNFLDPIPHKGLYDLAFCNVFYTGDNPVIAELSNCYQIARSATCEVNEDFFLKSSRPNLGFSEFPDGGLVFFRSTDYRALVRLPKFKFKPSQDDVGHLDIIHRGKNCLLDGGTFSYFSDDHTFRYYQGVQSHNTIYRSNKPYAMSKLSRFIFGDWTSGEWEIKSSTCLRLTFHNNYNDSFERVFNFGRDFIEVTDRVIESDSNEIVSAITICSNDIRFDKENSASIIKDDCRVWTILSAVSPEISQVPVSFCYGTREAKTRIKFPVTHRGNTFAIRF